MTTRRGNDPTTTGPHAEPAPGRIDGARIAYDVCDLVIQRLFAAGMSLQSVTNLIDAPVAHDRVLAVIDELDEMVQLARSAISCLGRRDEAQSLRSHLAGIVEERFRHLRVAPHLIVDGSVDDLPDFVADELVVTLTESVSNVARHAHVTDVVIRITRMDGVVSLTVRDNGEGIAVAPEFFGGLSTLMLHAAELGGTCSLTPLEPTGTELAWQVPI